MDHSRSSRSRHSKQEKSSPKNFNNSDSYDMTRLELGPSIGKQGQHQELQSRMKSMVYSNKMLGKTEAIIVPSLPSILSGPSV